MQKTAFLIFCVSAMLVMGGDHVQAQTCSGREPLTAKKCSGDEISPQEQRLFTLVNEYRTANHKPALRLSPALSMVANRRMLDLKQNLKQLTHSWSDCPYDISNQKTWPCVIDAPTRLNSGYTGHGYETLYHTQSGAVDPAVALAAWRGSKLHNSIILNLDSFASMRWDEVGVAIDGPYAALWFGSPTSVAGGVSAGSGSGGGISFSRATGGLSKLLIFSGPSGSAAHSRWNGTSADHKLRIEIEGEPNSLERSEIKITAAMPLGEDERAAVSTLIKNIFANSASVESWADKAIRTITDDPSSWQTMTVEGRKLEMGSDGGTTLIITIRPT